MTFNRRSSRQAASDDVLRFVAAYLVTTLACLLVLVVLIAPTELGRLTPGTFVRIPLEALLGGAFLLLLPEKPRRLAALLF